MSWGKKLIYIAVATALFALFQNCAPNRFATDEISGLLTAVRRGGDGQVFDGKLRILHNIVDGYTCEGQMAPESILILDTDGVWSWIQNTADKCAAVEKVVDSNLVDYDESTKTAYYDGKKYVPPRPYFVQASGDANTPDANVKDGVCADATGRCSLKAATDQAVVTALTDEVVVNVPTGTFNLSAPLILTVPEDANAIKLSGQGATATVLDGGGTHQHFRIHSLSDKTVTIEKFRLINGWDPLATNAASIHISANPLYYGPLTAPDASVSINDCVFQNISNGTGVISVSPDSGSLQVHRSQFLDTTTHGIYIDKSNGLLVEDSNFERIGSRGVAVISNKNAVTIRNTSFSNGYEGISFYNCSNCLIENVTVTRFSAGGLYIGSFLKPTENPNPNYHTIIRNSTIYDNATVPMQGQPRSNLFFSAEDGNVRLTISNSILGMPSINPSPNCSGSSTAGGKIIATSNITTDNTCNFTDSSNRILDPMLEPLANNGGLTLSFLPSPGSPAINSGSNALCTPHDQRRQPRPTTTCDIGAIEL